MIFYFSGERDQKHCREYSDISVMMTYAEIGPDSKQRRLFESLRQERDTVLLRKCKGMD